tara:strand:- start:35189 stop:36058 length:870 start_codon:yes stop_codon:yes gene_type:complete
MAQRNTHRKNNSDDHFDLDGYINEKSNPEVESTSENVEGEGKSSWLKNSMLIFGFILISLLYFNNWSPKQVYGNIFGVDEYQERFEVVQQAPNSPKIVSNLPSSENIAGLEELKRLEELEQLGNLEGLERLNELENLGAELESLEGLEGLENLESSLEGLENLGESNELRKFALETAMEALNGIQASGQFGNEIQLGIQEAMKELEALNELENIKVEKLVTDATHVNSSFTEYSNQLNEIGISNKFTNSDIQKLHQANVPPSFLQQLNNLNLLEKLAVDSIIEASNSEN